MITDEQFEVDDLEYRWMVTVSREEDIKQCLRSVPVHLKPRRRMERRRVLLEKLVTARRARRDSGAALMAKLDELREQARYSADKDD
jgi:hypothetical protein